LLSLPSRTIIHGIVDGESEKIALLKAIGTQVRALRTGAALTVREFANRAELSVRFVHQVEAGEGNISIAGLSRIATALGRTIHELIPPPVDEGSIRSRVWHLLSEASEEDLHAMRRWLADRSGQATPRFIALIGLRGAGKSTVGPPLARRLKAEFIELDSRIEQAAGMSLGEIFMMHGEEYYRRLEREELARLFSRPEGCVLAPGGSIVTDPGSWDLIKQRCFTIWLHATPDEFMRRLRRQGDTRPMRGNPSAMAELKSILTRRQPLYAQADLTIRTTSKSPGSVIAQILKYVPPNTLSELE
jgi:XRE family aerobic/anaerobic benzoate catabolism transcriptional regulator